MEEFLNNLNASITALENGTSPEQSQQYLQNNSAESNFPESGAIQVRDLASFVGRLADGIQRFPVLFYGPLNVYIIEKSLLTDDFSLVYVRLKYLCQQIVHYKPVIAKNTLELDLLFKMQWMQFVIFLI